MCQSLSVSSVPVTPMLRSRQHTTTSEYGIMNASVISAMTALVGAIIGGLISGLASLLAQRAQARVQWNAQDMSRRQDLYKEFIEEASKCYIDALQHDKVKLSALVNLYMQISRMRILSSPKVLATARHMGRKILETYQQPNKTSPELMKIANSESFDVLNDFSEACREEFESLRAQKF